MAPKGFGGKGLCSSCHSFRYGSQASWVSGTSESRPCYYTEKARCKPRPLRNWVSLRLDKRAWEWIALISVHQALLPATWEPGNEATAALAGSATMLYV